MEKVRSRRYYIFMPIDESCLSKVSLKTAPRVSGAHPRYYPEESSHSGCHVQWAIQHLDDLESKKGKYICFLKMKRDTALQDIEDITFYPPDAEKAAAKYIQDWFITEMMALLSVVREFGLALLKHNYIGKEAISVKNQPTSFKKLEDIMRASISAILTMERRQEAAQHDISQSDDIRNILEGLKYDDLRHGTLAGEALSGTLDGTFLAGR